MNIRNTLLAVFPGVGTGEPECPESNTDTIPGTYSPGGLTRSPGP